MDVPYLDSISGNYIIYGPELLINTTPDFKIDIHLPETGEILSTNNFREDDITASRNKEGIRCLLFTESMTQIAIWFDTYDPGDFSFPSMSETKELKSIKPYPKNEKDLYNLQ